MKSNLIQILAVVLVSCALTSLGTVSKSIYSKKFKHYYPDGEIGFFNSFFLIFGLNFSYFLQETIFQTSKALHKVDLEIFVYCFGLLTVSLGKEYENEEVEETLSEPGPSIKRYLRARPLRWGKRGGSSPLRWGKRWGTLANGLRYGKSRISERMSFEESDIFFTIFAYMAHIRQQHNSKPNPPKNYFNNRPMFLPHLIGKKMKKKSVRSFLRSLMGQNIFAIIFKCLVQS